MSTKPKVLRFIDTTDFKHEHMLHQNAQGFYAYKGTYGEWFTFSDDAHYINTVRNQSNEVRFFVQA